MIVGTRVGIGPILPVDVPHLLAWADDPANARRSEPYLPKNVNRETDFWLNATGDMTRVFFAIRARPDAELVGHIQIHSIDSIHHSALIGILIGRPERRGQGLGHEAMALAVDYCWRHLNLSRIGLAVHDDNQPAIRLYEKLGFATEGVLRAAQFIDGRWIDLRLMAQVHPRRLAA